MSKTLYTFPKNPQADKVFIAAKYAGVEVECAKDFVYGMTNTTEEYLNKFPLGTVPAFETAEGVKLTSGNAIASYVGGEALAGSTAALRAEIQQYIDFADNHIYPVACTWLYPIYGYVNGPKKATPKTVEAVKKVLDVLERVLLSRTFLVGNAVTLADISVAVALLPLFRDVLEADIRAPYVNVVRYLSTLFAQPNFIAAIGEVKFCVKAIEAEVPAKKEGKKNKKDTNAGEKKKKEKQGPSEAEQLEKARELAEKELIKKQKERAARIAALPKSTMGLNDWKAFYSNNDEADSMKWLDENFDAEGWSLWRCDYKYNDELTRTFMSSNLIGGWFQRCDKLRNYSFASMCVFGDDTKSQIAGVWMFRGQNTLFEELGFGKDDSDLYTFKKLDYSNPEDKKMVHEHFSWEGEFADIGMKLDCGKIYK